MTDGSGAEPAPVLEMLMTASKVFTAVVAHSMTAAGPTITTTQLRLLVLLDAGGPMNLGGLAAQLGVDPSTASRTCEQLVVSKLVSRTQDASDRRQVTLCLSRRGAQFVARLMARRRKAFAQITSEMSAEDARRLALGLQALVSAAEGTLEPDLLTRAGHGSLATPKRTTRRRDGSATGHS